MQPAPPTDETRTALARALGPGRIERYMAASKGDEGLALDYYLWNLALCEAFYAPLHYAEVISRTAIHTALVQRFGPEWFRNSTLGKIMAGKYARQLRSAVARAREEHGRDMSAHHVAVTLPFGFWEHLTTKRFHRFLWTNGVEAYFPHLPEGSPKKRLDQLHRQLATTRRWRNRVAHYRAIFDKGPMKKYQDCLELIGWVCPVTAAYTKSVSRVSQVINERPGKG